MFGDGATTDSSVPVRIPTLTGATAIAGSSRDTKYVLRRDGTVWAWGRNTYGQLGNGTTTDSVLPVRVRGLAGATAISAGLDVAYAIASSCFPRALTFRRLRARRPGRPEGRGRKAARGNSYWLETATGWSERREASLTSQRRVREGWPRRRRRGQPSRTVPGVPFRRVVRLGAVFWGIGPLGETSFRRGRPRVPVSRAGSASQSV
ncbi:RCC1 domain-containing protein [Protofrankia sp. BMG5.30]|uniref:RCC1 domain-containing protein n=1 Tax=Protofrankia sp. BMG5.30 TaxID=1834514 RepID=UPI0020CA3380|nr:RCC1 domain-containing protein [Protofrankia sp. BMG5.30]